MSKVSMIPSELRSMLANKSLALNLYTVVIVFNLENKKADNAAVSCAFSAFNEGMLRAVLFVLLL